MHLKKIFAVFAAAALAVQADINTVAVPATMLHMPDAALGLGYAGKVDYSLTPGTYDSVVVTLSILPAAGGTALALTEVRGDVGVINVNANSLLTPQTFSVFFQTAAAQTGVQYIARINVTALASGMKTTVDNLLTTVSKTDKCGMFAGSGDGFHGGGAGTIPQFVMSDGPHGVRPQSGAQAVVFPTDAGLCCTWDTAMAVAQGQAMGEEFRGLGKNCQLGPALDLVCHPQGGRASEYFGEDPYLSGHMCAADVRGIQTKGVVATIKHYACNNKENNRNNLSANMGERSIQEIYLYNWKPCIVDAQCWGMMCAYNRINHSYCSSNKYVETDVLRNTWGYKYLMMTDWGAGADNFQSEVLYGVDISMPDARNYTASAISGEPDSIINMHVRRMLNAHVKIGDMVSGYNATAYNTLFRSATHRAVAKTVGDNGIILAKNTGNLLPLPKTGKKICLTGPYANVCRLGPGGSSSVNPDSTVTPQLGITQLLASVGAGASTIVTDIASADYVICFVGVHGEQEGADRPSLAVTADANGGDNDAQTALNAKPNNTIIVFTGGSAASAGNWSKAPAIVIAFYPSQEQGHSIADVLFGNVNPSGRLPVTFPADATQLIPNFAGSGDLNYPASDTAHGYFRANRLNQTPLFWFGHGLSYTTFSFTNLQISPATISAGDRVHVRATVTNTGSVAGKEVVQLYLSMPQNATLRTRVQDLRGFQKVSLNAGANVTVDFTLTQEDMQVYNPNGADYNGTGKWQVLTGFYGVRIGSSADLTEQPTIGGSASSIGFTVQ
jgi:beta-glucosidase